jgi:hypothetical protein
MCANDVFAKLGNAMPSLMFDQLTAFKATLELGP